MPRKKGTRRNIRTIERIVVLLKESEAGQLNTLQIYLQFVDRWISGAPTRSRLGNLLAKSKEFEQIGWEMTPSLLSGEYKVAVWGLNFNEIEE